MDSEEEKQVDLKKFKGHHRKFPWTLLLKIIIVSGFIAMIFYVTGAIEESKSKRIEKKPDLEIEIEV